jgi:hypothetical protein
VGGFCPQARGNIPFTGRGYPSGLGMVSDCWMSLIQRNPMNRGNRHGCG